MECRLYIIWGRIRNFEGMSSDELYVMSSIVIWVLVLIVVFLCNFLCLYLIFVCEFLSKGEVVYILVIFLL